MAYNKNEIADVISQINDPDELLQKLTELSQTDNEALALFFQDQTLIDALIKQLQSNSHLAEQSYQNFLTALKKQSSSEILGSLCADYDKGDALALGLLFQDPQKVDTLLQQLQERGGLDKLFSDFFAPALKYFSSQSDAVNTLGSVLLCNALAKYWLDPRCVSAINHGAIEALQKKLSPNQKKMIFATLNSPSFIKEKFAVLSNEQFKQLLPQLDSIIPQRGQEQIAANRTTCLARQCQAMVAAKDAQSTLQHIDANIIPLRQALSIEQARLITAKLLRAPAHEIANTLKAQQAAIIAVISDSEITERKCLADSLTTFFHPDTQTEKALEEYSRSISSRQRQITIQDQEEYVDWITTQGQEEYVELLIKRFGSDTQAQRPPIPNEYLVACADCLRYQSLLEGTKGPAIITGLKKILSGKAAQELGHLLAQDTRTLFDSSVPQFKNMIAILSGDQAVVRDFCMNYLKAVTDSFSKPLHPMHQAVFMEGLKSVSVEDNREALAKLALKSNTPPSRFTTWLVSVLPTWLCPDSLRERAKPAVGFTPEHIVTLQYIAQNNGQLPEVAINRPEPLAPVPDLLPPQSFTLAPAIAAAPPTGDMPTTTAAAPKEVIQPIAPNPPVTTIQFTRKEEPVRIGGGKKITIGFGKFETIIYSTEEDPVAGQLPVTTTSSEHAKISVSANRYGMFKREQTDSTAKPFEATNQSIPTTSIY